MQLATRLEKIPGRLEECLAEARVPGASLAVLSGEDVFETAAGFVNLGSRVEATTDSIFQIGSITKLFTTTLVMQLVDEGLVELDVPVRRYIPELQFADDEATEAITVRHLLTHSSGIDGDFFEDTGVGDDCVERYILACRALPQLHAPGEMFSYCNAGFVVAGRLVEKFRGMPWHRVLLDRIIHPAGLRPMGTEPEEAILGRAAVGHMLHPETGDVFVVPIWRLTRSGGPAGATPFAAARSLLTFAKAYLDGGKTAFGTMLLSEASVKRVQEHQMDVPPGLGADAWGLGWMLFDWGGKRVIGHDGNTIGQSAFFRVVPEQRLAVALLTNGGDTQAVYREIFNEIFQELAGIALPSLPQADPQLGLDLSLYTGRYQRISERLEVEVKDSGLSVTGTGIRPPMNMLPPQHMKLRLVDRSTFLVDQAEVAHPRVGRFLDFDAAGRPRYLHGGGRASPRVSRVRTVTEGLRRSDEH